MISFSLCPSVPLVRFRHPITLILRYANKRIVNNYNESVHRKEQPARINTICTVIFFTLFTFTAS